MNGDIRHRLKVVICEMAAKLAPGEAFDLILVGDGSGTTHDKSCGWFVTALDLTRDTVTFHSGGRSHGTNNIAELSPYIQPLEIYHANNVPFKSAKVLVVSDSEVTVRCGSREYARNANLHLWASIDWFESNGYLLSWRHVPRNVHLPSVVADQMAGTLRQSMERAHARVLSEASTLYQSKLGANNV